MGESEMIPCTALITKRMRLACSPSCKCKACDCEIHYAHSAHKLTVQIGERTHDATICDACNAQGPMWILSAMQVIALHYTGIGMASKFQKDLAKAVLRER